MTLTTESQSLKTNSAKSKAAGFGHPISGKTVLLASSPGGEDRNVLLASLPGIKNRYGDSNTSSRLNSQESKTEIPDVSFKGIIDLANEYLPRFTDAGPRQEILKTRRALTQTECKSKSDYDLFAEGKVSTLVIPATGNLRYEALRNNFNRYFKDCARRLEKLQESFDLMAKSIEHFPQHREEIVVKSIPSIIRLLEFIKEDFQVLPKVEEKIEAFEQNVDKTFRMLDRFKSQTLQFWSQNDKKIEYKRSQKFNDAIKVLATQFDKMIESHLEAYSPFEFKENIIQCFNTYGVGNQIKRMAIPLQTLIAMKDIEGIIFDVDDCLIGSEKHQQNAWKDAIEKYTNEDTVNLPGAVKEELVAYVTSKVRDLFKKGDMSSLGVTIHKCFEDVNALPKNEKSRPMDVREFDKHLSRYRKDYMEIIAHDGRLELLPDVREHLIRLHKMDKLVAICTSGDKEIADMMLTTLLDREARIAGDGYTYDVLISKKQRTYGDDPDVPARKPEVPIWHVAVSKMKDEDGNQIAINKIAIADDNLKAMINASKIKQEISELKNSFGAIIGLVHKEENLKEWDRKFLQVPDVDEGVLRVVLCSLSDIS